MENNNISPDAIEFHGTAKEWFGIWIVNLLLSIVTFGIYSAWAKVRRKKYFANNTYIAGRNFDYHATGGQIFIGRLIVVVGLVLYSFLSQITPSMAIIMPLLLLGLLPFLIIRSLRFNAAMTSFSNIRFRFGGTYFASFLYFVLFPLIAILTLLLALPIVDRARQKFVIGHHKFGTSRFQFDAPLSPFYQAFGLAAIWVGVATAIAFLLFGSDLLASISYFSEADQDPLVVFDMIGYFYIWTLVAFVPAGIIYSALIRNHIFAHATLEGGHRFQSTVQPMQMVWIILSNFAVTVVSLGLMLPWTQIRLARYLAANTAVFVEGSIDDLIGLEGQKASAIGDAYTDLEGIDIGLPV